MKLKTAVLLVFYIFLCSSVFSQEIDFETYINSLNKPKNRNVKVVKSFGSFIIPDDWVEINRLTGYGGYFYTHNSEKTNNQMTYVSIVMRSNRYAVEDHTTFRNVIMRQLILQVNDSEVLCSEELTEHDDPLYIFTMEDEETNTTIKRYYIVGDRKFILIHLTDFHHENITNAEEVVRQIADSFIWGGR